MTSQNMSADEVMDQDTFFSDWLTKACEKVTSAFTVNIACTEECNSPVETDWTSTYMWQTFPLHQIDRVGKRKC